MKVDREERVLIVPLDEVVSNLNLPISFLKTDVEGFERELLLGAQETIRRYKPASQYAPTTFLMTGGKSPALWRASGWDTG